METVTLNIDSKVYENFLKILKQFKPEEIQIVSKNNSFEKAKKYLHDELHKIDSGNAEFLTLEEFEIETKKAIS